jgi:hypothetical protein
VIHPDWRTDLRASRLVVIAICRDSLPLLLLAAQALESVATSCEMEVLADHQPGPDPRGKRCARRLARPDKRHYTFARRGSTGSHGLVRHAIIADLKR